jgi:membrane protein YqaA with SNARE-associated domain
MKNEKVPATLTRIWRYTDRIWTWITNPPTISLPGISSLWLPGLFMVDTFLIFPMDLLLAGYCYKKKDEAYTTAIFCAFCSTFSALLSYMIGYFAWEQVGRRLLGFLLESQLFLKITTLYKTYQFPAVFLGGLLPIPAKSITISAGFCKLALLPFVGAVLLSRLIRFLSVAYIAKNFGAKALESLRLLTGGKKLSSVALIFIIKNLWTV